MPVMQLVNGQVSTTAANSQTATDVVVTPSSIARFPTAPQFTILERETGELMLVTALGAQWTVQRGYSGTVAGAIAAGDHLDYSVTREMLLGGFISKVDEVVLAAPANTVTLSLPAGLPPLRGVNVRARVVPSTNSPYLMARFGADASANYNVAYHYGGPGHSNGVWAGLTYWRVGWGSNDLGFFDLRIDGLNEAIFTRYICDHWYFGGGNERYVMQTAGDHRVATVFSAITFALDSVGNGVWAATQLGIGSVFSLYGVP